DLVSGAVAPSALRRSRRQSLPISHRFAQPPAASCRTIVGATLPEKSAAVTSNFLTRVCSRFVCGRAGACFCARQGTRSVVWSFQISDEKRSIAKKQARPEGLRAKWCHAALRDLPRDYHCLRPAPCLAPFGAATRLATKREKTLDAPLIGAAPFIRSMQPSPPRRLSL